MSTRGGRPQGRPLSKLELRHLQLLLELRERAAAFARVYDERMEDFVLECRDDGCSARGMASELGLSQQTIHAWTTHARRRRNQLAHSIPEPKT